MNKRIIKQIEEYISRPEPVLICAHRDPDGDSIGCQLAFYDFLRQRRKGMVVSNDGELPAKYQFLDRRRIIKQPDKVKPRTWSAAVIFECSSLDRIGRVQDLLAPDTPLINIDHHNGNRRFGTVNWVDRDASACGEMVYRLVRVLGGRITRWPAELLLTSIITDTGRFHYKSTSPRTMRIVAGDMFPHPLDDSVSLTITLGPEVPKQLLFGFVVRSVICRIDHQLRGWRRIGRHVLEKV